MGSHRRRVGRRRSEGSTLDARLWPWATFRSEQRLGLGLRFDSLFGVMSELFGHGRVV
ncbi:putative proline-rich receptor-like protein kinase PERK13 [Iris pallida]|uniref:Proline-rich receptor-like protein kinase PERK13 n=1 Tax=Iris pallida TaxID=29817 RepID=A0AAX6FVH4_IRIPA|nr:putative proline-rich receptor-like protein kinase PERK13 [Iris pallida]